MKIDKILMPTDFSKCSNAALSYAVFLARHHQAEIHFLHVVVLQEGLEEHEPNFTFPDMSEILKRFEEVAESQMGRILEAHSVETLTVIERRVRAVSAASAIVEYAAENEIDTVVIGTHGRRGLRRFLLGSVAEEVVRSAPCPVITVPWESPQGLKPLERILVPSDFSADSRAALTAAKHLAKEYGSRIEVVHVVAPPAVPGGAAPLPLTGPSLVDLSDELLKDLDVLIAAAEGPKVPITRRVLFGTVATQISDEAAETETGLIVVGSHGLSGIRRFLLGSVAERVVRSAPCPVLVLRHPAAEAEDGASALDPAVARSAAASNVTSLAAPRL